MKDETDGAFRKHGANNSYNILLRKISRGEPSRDLRAIKKTEWFT
jgi:hypothetical protein